MKKGILMMAFIAVQMFCLNLVFAGDAKPEKDMDKDKIAKIEKKKKAPKHAKKIYPINKAKR